jgi:hypothetical protein
MIRAIVLFFIIAVVAHLTIGGWRAATGQERWSFIKTLTYSVGLAIISAVAMTLLVIFF